MNEKDATTPHAEARRAVEAAAETLVTVSHALADRPELAMQEVESARLLAGRLERAGLAVTRHAYDMETAFTAESGSGGPHLVICAEYDALPGIGHACGHNVIAAAAVGAGIALQPLAEAIGFRVTVLGTPAEEAIGGKAVLVERGAFDGADAAMMVHPAPLDIETTPMLAGQDVLVTVHGRAAHASLKRSRRGNALDALCDVYMMLAGRDLTEWERCDGVIVEGGVAANVVPERTIAHYFIRSRTTADNAVLIDVVKEEVVRRAEKHGCTVSFAAAGNPYREMRNNHVLSAAYAANARALGRDLVPQTLIGPESAASTDMGNVSALVPSIHPMIGIDSLPHLPHQAGFAAAAVSASADAAILDGATAMAWTVLDLVLKEHLLEQVVAEYSEQAAG